MADPQKLGRYELRRVLGKGAMGVVYEGYDAVVNRSVAIKTILRNAAIDAETAAAYSERFKREAQAAGRLNHPNIVHVYDFAEEGDVAYLVMEYIQGRELRSYFDAKEKFEVAEVVRIMGELLEALHFAHDAGVIHRDVKPANVMLDMQRRVKLADFGVARILDSDRSMAGTMVGTPAFMSPEQIKGGKIDRRTDIFSAGVVLYHLLTGEQPFKGEGAWTVAKKIVEEEPPPPSSVALSVSPAFDAVVKKALAKLPPQRFATARLFADALRDALTKGAPAAIEATDGKAKAQPKASDTELEFWRAIQASDDPAEFEFYLEQFPQGTYAPLARHKIAKLKEPLEAARKEAEEKARAEALQKARREAEARARQEALEKAQREEQARRDAAEKEKRAAEEKARRQAAEKARQDEALARLKAQEAASAKRAVINDDATVAMEKAVSPRPTRSWTAPVLLGLALAGGAAATYFLMNKASVPAPEQAAVVTVPSRPQAPAVDVETIRKETEERVRREYAQKSAAEQAALAKAAAEKEIAAKKSAAEKAAAEKAAQEKAAALEKAKIAADKKAAEKAAQEKAIAEKAAAEKAAAERAAAERARAEKEAADKAAAEKAAAEKVVAERAAAEKAAAEAADKERKSREAEELRRIEQQKGVAVYFGVRIGDSAQRLVDALGNPATLRSLGRYDAYTYKDPFSTSTATPNATFYVLKDSKKVQLIHVGSIFDKPKAGLPESSTASTTCAYQRIFKFADGSSSCFDDYPYLRGLVARNLAVDWRTMAIAVTENKEGCGVHSWNAWNYRGTPSDADVARERCEAASKSSEAGTCSCTVIYDSGNPPTRQALVQSLKNVEAACRRQPTAPRLCR